MSEAKNWYLELLKNGLIIKQKTQNRKISELHNAFSRLPGYRQIKEHLIELYVKDKKSTLGIFRLVPEGNIKIQLRKRVQIKNRDIDIIPDYIVVAYINDGAIYYIRSTSKESILNLPKSVTTLFRLDIRELKKVITKNAIKIKGIKSRNKWTTLIISKNFNYLFDESMQVKSKLEFISEKDYEPLIINNNNDLNSEKEYSNDLEEDNRQEIGRVAEFVVNLELNNYHSHIFKLVQNFIQNDILNINWVNEDGEKFKPYDFIINDEFYLEIKGSKTNKPFIYSLGEKNWGDKFSKKYLLLKLNFIKILDKTYENVFVYTHKDLQKMDMTPISFIVKIRENDYEK